VFALVLAVGAAGGASTIAMTGGCDGESSFDIGAVDAGAPSPVNHAACLSWATSFCASLAACPARSTAYSQGVCVPRFTLRCEIIASDPNVVFDAASVAACSQPDAANCDQPVGDLCLPPGLAKVGAQCLSGASCQSGACGFDYTYGQLSPCGSCLARPCDGGCPSAQQCGAKPEGGIGCVRVLAVGDDCTSGIACETSYCGPDGKCGALAQLGKPCSSDGTGLPPCADVDAFCADSDHTCHLVTPAGYGNACVPEVDAQYQCTGFGTCDYANNVCIPPAADGEFCDEVQGLACAYPAQCRDHRCLFPSLARCGN
jgi:hypothetical protein